jgi:hypothetical protein
MPTVDEYRGDSDQHDESLDTLCARIESQTAAESSAPDSRRLLQTFEQQISVDYGQPILLKVDVLLV